MTRIPRRVRWTLAILLLVIIAAVAATMILTRPAGPMPQALSALVGDGQVQVDAGRWLVFQPRPVPSSAGFIFYPGGLVDARAYAPAAHALAARGYLVVIVAMPLNLAFFDADRAAEVIRTFPSIRRWGIGGHSLGGVAAAMFIRHDPSAVQGLAFWASYPSTGDNLSGYALSVLSISGSEDKLSTPAKIEASRPLLPASTRWVVILGGNHSQFGYYGLQSGDGTALISHEDQQEQIVRATADWLSNLPSPATGKTR